MKRNDWTEQLRQRLSSYKAEAPDDLWGRIDEAMGQRAGQARKAKIVALRWRLAAAAAAILVVSGAGLYFNRSTIDRLASDGLRPKASTPLLGGASPVTAAQASGRAEAAPVEAYTARQATPQANSSALLAKAEPVEMNAGETVETTGQAEHEPVEAATTADAASEMAAATAQDKPQRRRGNRSLQYESMQTAGLHSGAGRRLSFAMHATNGLGYQSNTALSLARVSGLHSLQFANGDEAKPMAMMNYEERTEHNLPVSFGATVSVGLTPRISLSTGAVCTKATSDFIHASGANEVSERQSLTYIGIPLSASYSIWGNKYLKVYATAGGQADFNVAAKITSEGIDSKINKDKAQFSVNAAAGVEYDVIPQLGVYVEPGVKYYFDNGSNVENIFKDKPFNFSLQIGLRFNVK